MEEEEIGIEGFEWEDVSPRYSSSHGHYEHDEMLFLTLPQKIMSVCGTGRSQMEFVSSLHAVCSTPHIMMCHTPALPGGSLS